MSVHIKLSYCGGDMYAHKAKVLREALKERFDDGALKITSVPSFEINGKFEVEQLAGDDADKVVHVFHSKLKTGQYCWEDSPERDAMFDAIQAKIDEARRG